ncbi:phage tail spike protein [Macrococcoides caseolyticum]|uniref:phage tail spike protein n=1 Tax=Macrococcoides caseolyticum TaxID=69966 RepID=UPI001C5F7E11|nr:phage tail spike protein [Macrococcus caseolyticus]QYA34265.1 phage tail protein [Macrococcus caseolyticus]
MYKIILTNATNDNQKVVWDVKKDIKLLRNASMQKQEDGIDSVSISPVHNFVENSATFIQPYNTLIEIINEKTNVIEFKGRVLSPESEMTDSGLFTHELIFEGAEAYLKDSIQSYSFEFDKMPVENLKKVIAHHNNELKSEAYKHFKVGNVTVEKNIIPSDENYNEELKYFKRSDDKDTYETLMDLKEKYGGTFIFEPTNDVTLVHWLKETGNLTNTVIKIGKNLKSIQKKFDASEVITRLKPLGASSETANRDEIKLTISEVNNGSPYIDIPQLIKLFGIQTGTVTFDDKHTPETLKKAAEDWIKEHEKKQARISLSLDALDLSYLKLDPDEFKIYNKHRVICPPLNIDEDLKIISIKVDLLKPYDKEVSFGERELGYAELEKERSIKNTNLIINKTVPGIIDRQTGGINRDVMVLNDYKITFEDLMLHQSNLLDEVNQILNSEYLVDEEVRADLLLKAQNVESLSNTIKDALESADERTINATKLVGLQNKMNAYRTSLKSFVIAKEGAKISLLKRLQILQSQYTEKKFSDTLKSVAEKFGLTVNQYNELIGEPNVVQKAISVVTEQTYSKLANYVKSQDYQTDKNGIVERLNNSDSERQQLSNQISDRVTLTEYTGGIKGAKDYADSVVNGLEIGGRNLLKDSLNIKMFQNNTGLGIATQNQDKSWTITPSVDKMVSVYSWFNTNIYTPIVVDETYTLSLDIIPEADTEVKLRTNDTIAVAFEGKAGIKKRISITFKLKSTNPNFVLESQAIGKKITYNNLKLEKGTKATDWSPAPEDTDQKLTTMKTEIIQDGKKISQEVSQQIYNASSKTLNQTLSQYINSISTGHQFTYDENGNISDFTVGSSGIKLNARVIDMNDGDVIIKNGVTTITDAYIPKLFSKKATMEYLDAIGITARTLQAKDKQASVNIENGSITMNRDSGARMDIGLDGIQSFNNGGSLRFSLTPTLVTTSAVGTSVSNVYLGAAPTGEARIVDMNGIPGDGAIGSYSYRPLRTLAIKFPLKANGYIGIDGNELRIMSDGLVEGGYKSVRADKGYFSTVDANNEIGGAHFYIRPKRGGELRATYNDGGETSYANFRSDGIYAPWIDYNGHIPGSHFYIRPAYGGEVRLTATGTTNNWASLRSDGIYVPWIDFNGQIPGSHLYIRPGSGGEVRFTKTGTTDQFINIRANDGDFNQISYNKWVQKSREEWKTGIRKWEVNASEVLTNEVDIYEFYYKNDLDYLTRGSVIGDGYKVPDFWLSKSKNGIDNTSVIWTLAKAFQEQIEKNNDLENRLKILEDKLNG